MNASDGKEMGSVSPSDAMDVDDVGTEAGDTAPCSTVASGGCAGAGTSTGTFAVRCVHGSDKVVLEGMTPDTTVGELRERLAVRFGVPVAEQTNLILRGRNLTKVGQGTVLKDVGIDAGTKGRLVLVGMTAGEREQLLEDEAAAVRRDAARERAGKAALRATDAAGGGPRVVRASEADKGRFLSLEPLPQAQLPPGAPGPVEALALLERLQSDRGIQALMRKYGWTVGKLTEFAPSLSTGIVGVTSGCLLGYNK